MTLCHRSTGQASNNLGAFTRTVKNKFAMQDGYTKTRTFSDLFHLNVISLGSLAERTAPAIPGFYPGFG
jgi:hypothetical protein